MLYAADDPATNVYKVVSGVVALSIQLPNAHRQIVDFLFAGDVCGITETEGKYVFDCEAITEVTTCAVDARHVRTLISTSPDVEKAIGEEMMLGLKRIGEHLVAVGRLNTAERLLYFLRWLEDTYSERGLPTRPLEVPMTRTDLADYLGMQLETVSRAFAQLKEQDLITLPSFDRVLLHLQAKRRPADGTPTAAHQSQLKSLRSFNGVALD